MNLGSVDALSVAHRLLFPSPRPPHYEYNTFPYPELIWIPAERHTVSTKESTNQTTEQHETAPTETKQPINHVDDPKPTQPTEQNATESARSSDPKPTNPPALTDESKNQSLIPPRSSPSPRPPSPNPPVNRSNNPSPIPPIQCESIPALLFENPGATILLLFAHGNGCDLGSMHQTMRYYHYRLACHLIAFEYPGYGCHVGEANEQSINRCMKSVYDFVTQDLRFPPSRILLMGQSIGSGPVCELAANLCRENQLATDAIGGVILQSPYTDVRAVVRSLAGSMGASLVNQRWDNLAAIQSINCPVLLIHGKNDALIPASHSESLAKTCIMSGNRRAHLQIAATATHNVFNHDKDVIEPIKQFINVYLKKPTINESRAQTSSQSTSSSSTSSIDDQLISETSNLSVDRSHNRSPSPFLTGPNGEIIPRTLHLGPETSIVPDIVLQTYQAMLDAQRQREEARLKRIELKNTVKNNVSSFFKSAWSAIAGPSDQPTTQPSNQPPSQPATQAVAQPRATAANTQSQSRKPALPQKTDPSTHSSHEFPDHSSLSIAKVVHPDRDRCGFPVDDPSIPTESSNDPTSVSSPVGQRRPYDSPSVDSSRSADCSRSSSFCVGDDSDVNRSLASSPATGAVTEQSNALNEDDIVLEDAKT